MISSRILPIVQIGNKSAKTMAGDVRAPPRVRHASPGAQPAMQRSSTPKGRGARGAWHAARGRVRDCARSSLSTRLRARRAPRLWAPGAPAHIIIKLYHTLSSCYITHYHHITSHNIILHHTLSSTLPSCPCPLPSQR